MEFSKKTRELSIKKMQERTLDLLIIGEGITGAGLLCKRQPVVLRQVLSKCKTLLKEHLVVRQNLFTVVFVTLNNLT